MKEKEERKRNKRQGKERQIIIIKKEAYLWYKKNLECVWKYVFEISEKLLKCLYNFYNNHRLKELPIQNL